jgi:hypothetical protein
MHAETQPAAEAVVLQPRSRIATTIGLRWCIASRNHRAA